MGEKIIIKNKKASFNYELLDKFEAGIALSGPEIKSIRKGDISLDGSFILVRNNIVILKNANIKKYEYSTNIEVDPLRDRVLLLNKKEIKKISERMMLERLSLVPVKMYFKGNYVKLEIALGRGKKLYDKRETIKQRDISRRLNKIK